MSHYLRSLNEFSAATRQKIIDIYSPDFGPNFREVADSRMTKVNWDAMPTKVQTELSKLVRELRSQDLVPASLVTRLESTNIKLGVLFKECTNMERSFYSPVTRKRQRLGESSNIASPAAAVAVVNPMSNSRPMPSYSEFSRPPSTPSSTASPISTPSPNSTCSQATFRSKISGGELVKYRQALLTELQNIQATLRSWLDAAAHSKYSAEVVAQAIAKWKMTAQLMFEKTAQVHKTVVDSLASWDKHKRRLANEFENNDERYERRSKSFNEGAYSFIHSVYVDQLNEIEISAQQAVRFMYDVIDSAAQWRSVFPLASDLASIESYAKSVITEFARSTFIVWRQSEQVIKAGNKFKATVRLLVGPALRLEGDADVKVDMLTSDMIRVFRTADANKAANNFNWSACALVTSDPNQVTLRQVAQPFEYETTPMRTGPAGRRGGKANQSLTDDVKLRSMFAEFPDIVWRNSDRRTAKKDNDLSVCELKYAAVFQTTLRMHGESISLTCLSMPLILIVHASQECKAHGTIFWDNAFSKKSRQPFAVPDEVSWEKFSRRFFQWFSSQTRWCENVVPPHQVYFIQECVAVLGDSGQLGVSLKRFYHDRLNSPIKFNFWDWIYGIRKLICEEQFLQYLWQQNAVYGFASHQAGQELLLNNYSPSQHSAILLRFSTSPVTTRSGLSVGLVIMITGVENNVLVAHSLKPATLEDLKGSPDLRSRLQGSTVTRDVIYPNIDLKSLLMNYQISYAQDDRSSPTFSPHYIEAVPELVVPNNQKQFDGCCALPQLEARSNADNLRSPDVIETFNEFDISRLSCNDPFVSTFGEDIRLCSGDTDLSSIRPVVFPTMDH